MPVVAYVTRSSTSRFFSQAEQNVGNDGGNNYTLRKANGESLGGYGSVGQAQAAFARFHGPNRIHKWERRNLQGSIEQHVCIGTPLDPAEIWVLTPASPQSLSLAPVATALQTWVEPSATPGSVKLDSVSTGVIRTISDLSGSNNFLQGQGTPNPDLIEEDSSYNGRPSVNLFAPDMQGFSSPNLAAFAPPWTIIAVANDDEPLGVSSFIVQVDGAGDDFSIGDGGGGLWRMNIGAAFLDAGSTTDVAILTAKATTTSVNFRVNGVDIGTIAGVPDSGVLKIGGFDSLAWTGRFSFVMVANIADADNTRILQTERYLRERYQ